MLQLHRP